MKISRHQNPDDYLTKREYTSILNNIKEEKIKLFIEWLWFSARRLNEIIHIRVEDINFQKNQYRIGILKRRKSVIKIKHIPPSLIKKTLNYIYSKRLNEKDYLFSGQVKKCKYCEEGNHVSPRTIQMKLKQASEKIYSNGILRNIPVNPHRFRKSFGYNLVIDHIKKNPKTTIDTIPFSLVREIQIMLEDLNINTVINSYFAPIIDREIEKKTIKRMKNE
jgi:integrase